LTDVSKALVVLPENAHVKFTENYFGKWKGSLRKDIMTHSTERVLRGILKK
jgi:hypothetical protein